MVLPGTLSFLFSSSSSAGTLTGRESLEQLLGDIVLTTSSVADSMRSLDLVTFIRSAKQDEHTKERKAVIMNLLPILIWIKFTVPLRKQVAIESKAYRANFVLGGCSLLPEYFLWRTRPKKKNFLYDHIPTTEDYICVIHVAGIWEAKQKKQKISNISSWVILSLIGHIGVSWTFESNWFTCRWWRLCHLGAVWEHA